MEFHDDTDVGGVGGVRCDLEMPLALVRRPALRSLRCRPVRRRRKACLGFSAELSFVYERGEDVHDRACGHERGLSPTSYCGATSTTSMPQRPSRATRRSRRRTSRGRKPPGSGQPVPGTKPASSESTSKLRKTAFAPLLQATSSAISAALSTPIMTMSSIVSTVVPRPRPTFTPGTWRLPAADAELHEIYRRRIRNVGRVKPRTGVHPLVHVGLLRIDMPIDMNDPDRAIDVRGDAAHIRDNRSNDRRRA